MFFTALVVVVHKNLHWEILILMVFCCSAQAAKNQEEVDKLLKGLDFDGDGEVDFGEFVVLVAALTCACHDRCAKK